MEELSRQFKAGEINENQLKEATRDLIKGYGKDIGIDFDVVYLDEETMPKDSKGSTGSSYILDEKNRKVLIPIDVSKIGDINELLGTLTEEVSHGKDALEGRQDKKVAEDKSNDEKGLESLGRPANDYVKNKLGEDNNSKISLSTDGIDLTNADVGEKVGDVNTQDDGNSGYAETLPSQQKDPWLNKMHFEILKLKRDNAELIARLEQVSSGGLDMLIGGGVALKGAALTFGTGVVDISSGGTTFVFTLAPKAVGIAGMVTGGTRFWVGVKKVKNGIFGEKVEYQTHPIRDSKYLKGREDFYDIIEIGSAVGVAYLIPFYPVINAQENLEKSQANNYSKETTKIEQRQGEGQSPQQGQRSQDNLAQNNKNSINKTQSQGNQDYSNNQQGTPVSKTSDINKSGVSQGMVDDAQKAISANTNQNVNPLIISNGTLNNGTKYVVIESSSEKIKSIDELLTKEGQAKLPNTSMEELETIAQKEGYGTQFISDTKGSVNGQRLIITGHKSIGSIRSNSEGTHEMVYKVVSGNFKDKNNNPLPGKIKVLEGKPEEYHTRGNTPEKAELIFVEKKEKISEI